MVDLNVLFTLPTADLACQQYEGLGDTRKSLAHPNAGTAIIKATLVAVNTKGVAVEGQANRQLRARSKVSDKGPCWKSSIPTGQLEAHLGQPAAGSPSFPLPSVYLNLSYYTSGAALTW